MLKRQSQKLAMDWIKVKHKINKTLLLTNKRPRDKFEGGRSNLKTDYNKNSNKLQKFIATEGYWDK